MWPSDVDLDEPVSCEVVAQTVGARHSLVVRLARQGLIETVEGGTDEPLVPRRVVVQLRRMQRLRRDLGVNFAGAAVILDLVRRILSRNGYSISVASSARLALQMIQHRSYDAILCDIKMPDMDGITFYEHFQTLQMANRPRVIIMTGDTSNAQTEIFLRHSKLAVLHKPFNGQELLAAIMAPELDGDA